MLSDSSTCRWFRRRGASVSASSGKAGKAVGSSNEIPDTWVMFLVFPATKQKTHLPILRRWVGYNLGVKRAYKTGSSPKQDTAAPAVICRRQQQAAVVRM